MVKIMENPIEMDDSGETHYFRKPPYAHHQLGVHDSQVCWMGEFLNLTTLRGNCLGYRDSPPERMPADRA